MTMGHARVRQESKVAIRVLVITLASEHVPVSDRTVQCWDAEDQRRGLMEHTTRGMNHTHTPGGVNRARAARLPYGRGGVRRSGGRVRPGTRECGRPSRPENPSAL
jgi:hypothetical protein